MSNDTKMALVLAQRLTDTKEALVQFDDLAIVLRTLADENEALKDQLRFALRLTESASAEADRMGDLFTELTGRCLRLSLALRQDGDARAALLKAQKDS